MGRKGVHEEQHYREGRWTRGAVFWKKGSEKMNEEKKMIRGNGAMGTEKRAMEH